MDILKRIENKAGSIQVKELPDDNLYLREKSYLEKIISEKEKELNELKLLKSAYENPLAEKEEIVEDEVEEQTEQVEQPLSEQSVEEQE